MVATQLRESLKDPQSQKKDFPVLFGSISIAIKLQFLFDDGNAQMPEYTTQLWSSDCF